MSLIIEQLLHEEESSSLDFKREQYLFSSSGVDEKSELLKDVLAFSNSWRRNDAYILLGISEVKGGRSEVVGVESHIDDAQLQQFVNSKTNRPIEFSYCALELEGIPVAYIKIPVQTRPFYLKKDYGKLKKNVVYIRRGSSTGDALPDEISEMGQSQIESNEKKPILSSFLVSGKHDEIIEKKIVAETVVTEVPGSDDLPDFPIIKKTRENILAAQVFSMSRNSSYFRDLAYYERIAGSVEGVSFGVRNEGNTVARDVTLTFDILGSREEIAVVRRKDLPSFPNKERNLAFPLYLGGQRNPDIEIEKINGGKRVRVKLGKIQAKDISISNDSLFLGVTKSSDIVLDVKVYSDDIEAPSEEELVMSFNVSHRKLTVRDIIEGN